MTQKMVMTVIAIAIATKKKMEMKIADDGSISNGLDPEYVCYRGDPSCLLHGQ
jgi:hypothetical protein